MTTGFNVALPAIVAAVLAAPPSLAQDAAPPSFLQDLAPAVTAEEFAALMLSSTTRQRERAENPVPTVGGSPILPSGEIAKTC